MKSKIIALAASLLPATAGAAHAQTTDNRQIHFACELAAAPDWVRRPTGRDIGRVYPRGAAASRQDGRTIMDCSVAESGQFTGCRVIEESPAGRGFGAAALKLAPLFEVTPPRCQDGSAAAGTITVPIRWQVR